MVIMFYDSNSEHTILTMIHTVCVKSSFFFVLKLLKLLKVILKLFRVVDRSENSLLVFEDGG